jgi:hypothetical protein
MICLLCVYICHYIFPFYYLDIFVLFLTYLDRKHYYIKVVESIQFVCTGNSGISRVLCNANTYQSIHEGLFFNSSPALDLKYPLRLKKKIKKNVQIIKRKYYNNKYRHTRDRLFGLPCTLYSQLLN